LFEVTLFLNHPKSLISNISAFEPFLLYSLLVLLVDECCNNTIQQSLLTVKFLPLHAYSKSQTQISHLHRLFCTGAPLRFAPAAFLQQAAPARALHNSGGSLALPETEPLTDIPFPALLEPLLKLLGFMNPWPDARNPG